MPYLELAATLLIIVGGSWLFLTLDPKAMARGIRYAVVGILVMLGLFVAFTGRVYLDLPIGGILFLFVRSWLARGFPGLDRLKNWLGGKPHSIGASTIETAWLRMNLDRATGALDGQILFGRFSGQRLSGLTLDQLRALLVECESADAQSARLIEAYLDRAHGGWRDQEPRGSGDGDANPPMTADIAWQVLGLKPGASPDEIADAHHRLMMKLHPDHAGSTYLASQINRARDLLLSK